jgi:hypothetical protein
LEGVQPSCAGTTYVMRASVPQAGELRFVNRDPATACSPLPPAVRGVLEQVLPPSAALTGLQLSVEPGWQPLTDATFLPGDWSAEGGGHVLELVAGGTYSVADSSGDVVDRGAWTFSGSNLTLTSAAGSTACRAGDKVVLTGVQFVQNQTRGLRGTVGQNACAAAWTPVAWFLLPNANS